MSTSVQRAALERARKCLHEIAQIDGYDRLHVKIQLRRLEKAAMAFAKAAAPIYSKDRYTR